MIARWSGSDRRVALAWSILFALLLVTGAALRLWQYLGDPSQNVDELAVSRSIAGLGWGALARGQLAFHQVAPPGFVLLEKAAVTIGGADDRSLRSYPLVCSLLSLALFLGLARRLLAGPAAVALALVYFGLRPDLIDYAAQVKPYASDLLVALSLTLLALAAVDAGLTPRRGLLLGAAGFAGVTVSYAAVLVLAGLGPALLLVAWRPIGAGAGVGAVPSAAGPALGGPNPARQGAALATVLWTAAALAAVAWQRAAMTPLTAAYLHNFWAAAFAPWQGSAAANGRWLLNRFVEQLPAAGLGDPWRGLCGLLAVGGTFSLCRRHGAKALLLCAPVAALAAATEAHLYPFSERLVLFAVPALVLASAAGLDALAGAWRWAGGSSLPGAALVAAALLAAPLVHGLAGSPPVYRREETKPVLRQLAQRRQPGDVIYAYYGAGQAVLFYGPDYGLLPRDITLGRCARGDTRAYLRELDRFRGRRRVWVVLSHALPALGEETAIVAYLDAIGTPLLTLRAHPHPPPAGFDAEALLYDLATRRAPAAVSSPPVTAETFPLPPARRLFDPRFACVGPHNSASSPP